jgi:hypothetical protein
MAELGGVLLGDEVGHDAALALGDVVPELTD